MGIGSTLFELFPDLGESVYENWDFKQADVLMAFLNQRMLAAPDETRHIWKLDGPLEDNPNDEVPSMVWLHMAHTGPLPPIWDLLDLQSVIIVGCAGEQRIMSPGMGSTSPMYAASGNRGAVDTPAANQGPLGSTFTPSKLGVGLRAFEDNAPDALSRLCENHILSNESEKPAHKRHQAFLASIEPMHRIPDAVFKQIAAVHNSMVGHWGLQKCREFLNDPTITDRTITQFIRQCPCCQVMSRLKILIKTHPFT